MRAYVYERTRRAFLFPADYLISKGTVHLGDVAHIQRTGLALLRTNNNKLRARALPGDTRMSSDRPYDVRSFRFAVLLAASVPRLILVPRLLALVSPNSVRGTDPDTVIGWTLRHRATLSLDVILVRRINRG